MNSKLNKLSNLSNIFRFFYLLIILFPINCFATIDFYLVNANTDNYIRKMTNDETVDLNQVGRDLNICAEIIDVEDVKSVGFELNDRKYRVENYFPYTLAGDYKGDYYTWTPNTGRHNLKAVAYGSNLNKLDENTIQFNITSSVNNENLIFTLINASNDKDIYEIEDKDTIDFNEVGKNLTIRVDVSNDIEVGFIRFELDDRYIHTEGFIPYTLAGDYKGDYYEHNFTIGSHSLKASVYDRQGTIITEDTINFDIIDSDGDSNPDDDGDDNSDSNSVILFTLVNAANDDDIFTLNDNSTINMSKVGKSLTIRADVSKSIAVSAIRFELNDRYVRTEGFSPYTLAGDKKGDYYAYDFSDGQYTLKAIGYGFNANIVAEGTIRFTLLDSDDESDSEPSTDSKFNKNRDVLSLHFDHRADLDDGHATVANRTVTLHYDIKPHVVSGTYGYQSAPYQVASEQVMQTVWGNGGWLNAHKNRSQAVSKTTDVWKNAIDNGGHVWVAEGGQSDFTADVVKELRKNLSKDVTKAKIHIVQHSNWNETYTRSYNLTYLKDSTDYIKIADGNKKGNGTAGLREEPDTNSGERSIQEFKEMAQNSKYSKIWNTAFNYLNPLKEKLDFSDSVELMHILEIGTKTVADCDDFSEIFLSH